MNANIITDISQLDLNKTYAYADYLLWQFSERVELIKGKIFKMSPAPGKQHQIISGNFHVSIGGYLKQHDKKCRLLAAPFDVRLLDSVKSKQSDRDIYTVVQPDLCLICDESKLDERGCIGAPDLIIEILSPGNSKKEMKIKYELYEENGVQEYWVVFPYESLLQRFVLNAQGKFELAKIYTDEDIITTPLLPDWQMVLGEILQD
ncbi:Uma2 family endonuclease [Rhodoflexus caldus]|uniref:Uma2 family endonuclease n=1 Tax=Rhodoflexus caldus TaxID=2891236 RepID=UPI00202A7C2A|nr:Uma2 family endonuclease [Rhodoflexus caldus]